MIDRVISAGRYRVGRRLDRGGMAQVRLGLDVRTGHAVAVKYLDDDRVADELARRLFSAETEMTAALDHPGVVRVLDAGETDDLGAGLSTPYLVMEYVPGSALSSLTRRGEPVPPGKALQLTRDLLDALKYCHEAGLVHGDVKPTNVMVLPTGRIKLMDFGVARQIKPAEQAEVVPCFATIKYASPEQIQQLPTDGRSDLYAVGCVLFELLTGRPPFLGEPEELLAHHLNDQPVAPSTYQPDLTGDIDSIVLRALQKDPHDRYSSAGAMLADVDLALHLDRQRTCGHILVETPATDVPELPLRMVFARAREVRRRRFIRSVSGVAAAVLPVAGFGLLHMRGSGETGGASAAALNLGGVVEPRRLVSPPATSELPTEFRATASTSMPGPVLSASGVYLRPAREGALFATPSTSAPRRSEVQPEGDAAERRVDVAPSRRQTKPKPKPKPVKPRPVKATPVKPAPVKPAPVKPKPVKPAPVKPKPVKPAPVKPAPVKPKPVKPKPVKPKPVKPKPVKPKPVKPKPAKTKPKPKPAKTKPKPDKPKPKPDKPKPKPVKPKPKDG